MNPTKVTPPAKNFSGDVSYPAKIDLPSDQNASGRSLGEEEVANLAQVIQAGRLTSTRGTWVSAFESAFQEQLGVASVVACSSGTAAIHTAVVAVDPEPGEEIITSPITDMGAITPILYQGAIPVFADVDPTTCNVTAATVEQALSERTKAIIVTHLFGKPCPMQEIMEVARARQIPVIEDCAQAYLARSQGELVGAIGDLGCFSLQQGKHITTGEGGMVVTSNPDWARRAFLFVNKAWGYGDSKPDHYFLALNYRMTELQGAVAMAQLEKLNRSVTVRVDLATRLNTWLADVPGVFTPQDVSEDYATYWKYCLRVDSEVIPGGAVALGALLQERGIACAPRYIQKPAFQCQVIAEQCTFGSSRWPFSLARPEATDYRESLFPGTFSGLSQILVLPWNEAYTTEHVDFVGQTICAAVQQLSQK